MPSMTLLIGIDEAGYGPNLGPLCIGASVWSVDEHALAPSPTTDAPPGDLDLYQLLAEIVTSTPDGERIAIADSKQLYSPGGGLAELERGVLAALGSLREDASSWRALIEAPELPWYADYDCGLPIDADCKEIGTLVELWQRACESAGARLVDLQVRMVFPQEFNELTEHYGTKGAALSHVSIELLRNVLENLPPSTLRPPPSVHITCDKHGGRNRYAALLQHHFSDDIVQVVEESRAVSRYHWGPREARTEICFRTKGEAELPVALASMAAKYHRELAMRAFNAFWCAKIPGLKPTAGYPVDAKRFKKAIAAVQSELEIDDALLWRNR